MDPRRWPAIVALRCRSLFRRRTVEQELDEELRYHLEQQTAQNIAGGMEPAAARAAALRAFGGVEVQKERARDTRGLRWLDELGQDLRYGLRTLRHSPSFTAVSVATLGLGIGASTAIFSVVNGVLLRPLPYPDPGRLVQVWERNTRGHPIQVADPNFRDLAARAHDFVSLAEMNDYGLVSVSGGTEPARAQAAAVSRGFFHTLGVEPRYGRAFLPEEHQPGGPPAAVVSYGFWQRALGGRPDALGTTLHGEDRTYTVVGVMPPTVNLPVGTDIWLPRELYPVLPSRSAHNWQVLGRLRAGVPLEQADREVDAIMRSLRREYGDQVTSGGGTVVSLREHLVGDTRPTLLLLFAASLVLLLIAGINAANLMVARIAARQGEVAVRTALGAGRGRLARQFLAECLLFALAGGVAGVVLARVTVTWMLALQSGQMPRAAEVGIDWRVLGFAFAVSLLAGAAIAVLAAWRSGGGVRGALAGYQRTVAGAGSGHRLRSLLVVSQFALTLALLVGVGLLARSFERILTVQPGFATSDRVVLDLSAPGGNDSTALRERVRLYDAIVAGLQGLPGVVAVGGTGSMPLTSGGGGNGTFLIMTGPDERVDPSNFETLLRDKSRTGYAEFRLAGPGYFDAMHIPVARGRAFQDRDTYDAPNVALISRSLAEERWPGRDPIGQVIQFGNMDGDLRPFTIVGIVGDVHEADLTAPPRSTFYADYRQRPVRARTLTFVLATRGDPAPVIRAARATVRQLAPAAPVRVRTIEDILSVSMADRRFVLVLVGAFGSVALLLAVLGVYGLVAYLATQRRREIGIRLALGAGSGNVVRLVMNQGTRLAAAGIVAGAALAFVGTRMLGQFLYDVNPADPVAFAGVAMLLGGVAMFASWVPARRASRVPPAEVLKA